MAVTDRVGSYDLEYVVKTLVIDCAAAFKHSDILALPCVEITYAPMTTSTRWRGTRACLAQNSLLCTAKQS